MPIGRSDPKKDASPIDETPFILNQTVNYLFAGFIVEFAGAIVLAGFIVEFAGAIVLAGFIVELAGAEFVVAAGETAATVGAGVATITGLTAFVLFALLLAVPPQAIPRALRPKTAENTNTFVILLGLLSFSKNINFRFRSSVDETQPFCLKLFLFRSNRENRNPRDLCQPKIDRKPHFLHLLFWFSLPVLRDSFVCP